ncbi:putative esterase PIR7A [Dichanthelium oligosanthes]|uniref:Putative esterase PIR7A n=1 Tax=Dichanthelium oligosanthes TaxID=888268 RepID=A0A1E5VAH1_9POAL|nr:putative esterase PIR7A [Dichanthelium oligosanthes]
MMENNGEKQRRHFVLVHGLCHGTWCWYKVATVLESAGRRVTALDLPACGASAVRAEECSRPLLSAVATAPPGEEVVLVGHRFGGHNLALPMQAHPEKVAFAVFVPAPVPVAGRPMSAVLKQHLKGDSAPNYFLDCTFGIVERGSENPTETFLVGPEWMSAQPSRVQDLTLARTLVRPAQMFLRDEAMTGEKVLTKDRYGAVTRVFVVAEEDKTWPAEQQRRVATSRGPGVEKQRQHHHFVLVHGVCHGAWCWYKVATVLSSAGHRVTALDMAACGARPGRAEEVPSFEEYSRPLLDAVAALPPGEKAVLVGHSFGGQSLALAMERYPDRVAVAVFVSAAMPAAGKPMTLVFEQVLQEQQPADFYLDCKIETSGDPQHPVETLQFGPRYLEQRLYQLSPPEDLTLAMAAVRPSRRFLNDATMEGIVLTAERYGAVRRAYIVAEEDASWSAEFQRRMASWNPGTEVRGLQGADHMPMLSKPRELSKLLLEIADKYS